LGFGISDEVLEKIIMEPWLLPSERGYTISSSLKTIDRRYKPNYPPPPVGYNLITEFATKYAVKNAIKNAATKKEEENVLFIKITIGCIHKIYTSGVYFKFHSIEIKRLLDNVKDYFNSTADALGITAEPQKFSDVQEKHSINYIFQGLSDQVYYLITSENMDKIRLRNIVNDVYLLMNLWGLNGTGETVKKNVFFLYFAKEYGLSIRKFRCCSHCGAQLYSEINNCPKCLENTRSTSSYNSGLEQKQSLNGSVITPQGELAKIKDQLRSARDSIKAQTVELDNRQRQYEEERAELTSHIEYLQKLVEEKDQAISAYKDHIIGISHDEQLTTHSKILVIGEFLLSEQEARSIALTTGISYETLVFYDEYSKIKNLSSRINETSYVAIIIGAVPHKVKNLNGENSLSSLFKRDGYPFTVEAKIYNGELKLTRESFRRALSIVVRHLMSKGLFPL